MSNNEVCNTAYDLSRMHEQSSIFNDTTMGPMIPKEIKIRIICTMVMYGETLYGRQMAIENLN